MHLSALSWSKVSETATVGGGLESHGAWSRHRPRVRFDVRGQHWHLSRYYLIIFTGVVACRERYKERIVGKCNSSPYLIL